MFTLSLSDATLMQQEKPLAGWICSPHLTFLEQDHSSQFVPVSKTLQEMPGGHQS